MKYKDINAYVKANGFKVSDLTEEELAEAKEELVAINNGETILDGVFSNPDLEYRKMRKEAK